MRPEIVVKGFKFHILEAELLDVLRLPDSVGRTELQAGCVFQFCRKIIFMWILTFRCPICLFRLHAGGAVTFTFTLGVETSSCRLSERDGNL